MHTQVDEKADNKALVFDGGSESAAVNVEQTPDTCGEAGEFGTPDSETHDGSGEGEGGSPEAGPHQTHSVAVEGDSRGELTEVIERPGVHVVRPEATTEVIGQEDASTSDDEALGDEALGDEIEPPQPLPFVELPDGFDWRKLKPRVYGKSLPPLDPVDLQSLEHSIVSRGILHKILIDELSNIIDGNTRWEICIKEGIVPPVEMVSGLTEEEKEEEAISSNVARRQLKDPEVERQIREVRLENMFKGREKNPKKFTLKKIARAIGVSVATVSLRWSERQNSQGENASIVDARQLYGDDLKSEAVRLVKMGMPVADVSRLLPISRKAVERAVKKEKDREAGGSPAKGGKGKKKTPARRKEPTEDLAANEGVPDLHQRVLEHLGLSPEDYANIQEDARDGARETLEKIATDDAELLLHVIYGKYLTDFGEELLERRRRTDGEEDAVEESPETSYPSAGGYEAGEILSGTVLDIEPEGVLVELPNGDRGVIGASDEGLTWHGPPDEGEEVRVEVNGFDSERDLFELGLVDRDPTSQDESVDVVEPDLDDLSTYERHFGRGEGSEE